MKPWAVCAWMFFFEPSGVCYLAIGCLVFLLRQLLYRSHFYCQRLAVVACPVRQEVEVEESLRLRAPQGCLLSMWPV